MRTIFLLVSVCLLAPAQDATQGSLRRIDAQGRVVSECPLKRTTVTAEISGMLARVNVVQEFQNLFRDKIEAVYVFPLPHGAAVDDMTMVIGSRKLHGVIKRREEAAALYQAARDSGRAAALLDQERPNIFTQSVANVLPGQNVEVHISYVETLRYNDGLVEFVYPMAGSRRFGRAGRSHT